MLTWVTFGVHFFFPISMGMAIDMKTFVELLFATDDHIQRTPRITNVSPFCAWSSLEHSQYGRNPRMYVPLPRTYQVSAPHK